MDRDIILLDETEQRTRSAAEIFKSTVGLTMKDDKLCVVFSTIENRKGYGKQYIPISELESVMAVLLNAQKTGIHSEDEELSTSEVVKQSLIESENGEIRFKTESSKGKKPTLLQNKQDFDGFVSTLEQYAPKIIAKAQSVKDRIK